MRGVKVMHKTSDLGFGIICSLERVADTFYAAVAWDKVRTPALSFHPLTDLVWHEVEGVDGEGSFITDSYHLVSISDALEASIEDNPSNEQASETLV